MEETCAATYEKVYHYTTSDGLLGILKDKTLWATHYRFLNDYSETSLFRDKLVPWLSPYLREEAEKTIKHKQSTVPGIEQRISQEGGLDQLVQHDTEAFVDGLYHAIGKEIYILSFVGQHKDSYIDSNGLLSQWRGYGTGGGFALVFNTKKLEEILTVERERFEYDTIHCSDVIYSNDEDAFKEKLSEHLFKIADEVERYFNFLRLSEEEQAAANKNDLFKEFNSVVSCITRFKHRGFSEENEVRVVAVLPVVDQEYLRLANTSNHTVKPEKERKLRCKNGQLVPYIELFNSEDTELPIERIIVGPHKEKEDRAAALRKMLRNKNIDVTCSDIPFAG